MKKYNNFRSKQRSFLIGMSSSFDFTATLNTRNFQIEHQPKYGQVHDARAIRQDMQQVGKDFQKAISSFEYSIP